MEREVLTSDITRLRIPYADVFTSVFLVGTEEGMLLFDTGSYPADIEGRILPALAEIGVPLTHVMLSHTHEDHAGGLATLLAHHPGVTVVAGSNAIARKHEGLALSVVRDGDILLGVLRVVSIPGHTTDSVGLLDTRTGTLLSGDGLQLYGLFAAEPWGANISFPAAHLAALDRLAALPIAAIYPAHAYHPLGDAYIGEEGVFRALALSREPLLLMRDMLLASPEKSDVALAAAYNAQDLPRVTPTAFAAIRRDLLR